MKSAEDYSYDDDEDDDISHIFTPGCKALKYTRGVSTWTQFETPKSPIYALCKIISIIKSESLI